MNLSMNWFRSQKQKDLEALKVKGQKLKNKLLKKELNSGWKELKKFWIRRSF